MLGRYDTESKLITLIDRDYDPDESTSLLAHEFAHALQDQSLGLDRIWEGVSSEDEYMAVRSIVEGEAEHIGVAFDFAAGGDPLADWEWADVSRYAKSDLLEYVRNPEIPLLDTASSFPYLYGFAFMTEAYLEDGPSTRIGVADAVLASVLCSSGGRRIQCGGPCTLLGDPGRGRRALRFRI